VAARRREQCTVSGVKPRPRDLAPQDVELVAQDQQLDVLDIHATAIAHQRAQQRPEREVEEGEGHTRDRLSARSDEARHEYWRPSALARRLHPERRPPEGAAMLALLDLAAKRLATPRRARWRRCR